LTNNIQTLAEFLRQEMKTRQLKPSQLARLMGIGADTLSRWLGDDPPEPKIHILAIISRGLNIPIEEIVTHLAPDAVHRDYSMSRVIEGRIEALPEWKQALALEFLNTLASVKDREGVKNEIKRIRRKRKK